jgi:hypothetical protein
MKRKFKNDSQHYQHFNIFLFYEGEGTCQPDQTYAVVDKARKRKYNPDETNKKKFVINYGNS